MKPTIGIIGYGIVGKALEHVFKDKCNILIKDPLYPQLNTDLITMCRESNVIFVGVPTPMIDINGGPSDTTIIDNVIKELNESLTITLPVICIKSAIIPNKLKEYTELYPKLRLTVSPEFLTEKSYLYDMEYMRSLIVGGKDEDCDIIINLFLHWSICKPFPYAKMDLLAGGVLKYMENCFLATKVIFMNQFYDILKESGSTTDWMTFAKAFHLDPRMGTSHYAVPGPDGDRGFGGKCFPKDLHALVHYAKELNCDIDIIETVLNINKKLRTNIDWKHIPGAVTKKDKNND